MDTLVIITHKFTKEFPIPSSGEVSIGRGLENTLCFNDETVSRHHAKIFRKDNVYYLEDLGSANGTLLRGHRIPPHKPFPLSHNDQIQLGKYQIICKFGVTPSGEEEKSEILSALDLDEITQEVPEKKAQSQGEQEEDTGEEVGEAEFDLDLITSEEEPAAIRSTNAIKQTERYSVKETPGVGDKPFSKEKYTRKTVRLPVYQAKDEPLPSLIQSQDLQELNGRLLVFLKGGQKEFPITLPLVTIGRGRENDISIPHGSVSKYHAKLVWEEGEFVLYDLNSTNGTLVNGTLIQRCSLACGDTILFGQVEATFLCDRIERREVEESEISDEEVCQVLLSFGVLSRQQLALAKREALKKGKTLQTIVISRGWVSPIQWAQAKEVALEGLTSSFPLWWILLGFVLLLFVGIGLLWWLS